MENEENNVRDLESAINSPTGNEKAPTESVQSQTKMTPEEEIAFHKGALTTLVNERNELVKIVSNVENIMQVHISRLKELGVNFE